MIESAHPAWQPLRVRTEARPGAMVVRPSGEVDLAAVPQLRSMLTTIAGGGHHAIVSLGEVTYIDSSGIKALFDVHRLFAKRERRLALAEPSSVVQRILAITEIEKIIPVFASVDQALRSLPVSGRPE